MGNGESVWGIVQYMYGVNFIFYCTWGGKKGKLVLNVSLQMYMKNN